MHHPSLVTFRAPLLCNRLLGKPLALLFHPWNNRSLVLSIRDPRCRARRSDHVNPDRGLVSAQPSSVCSFSCLVTRDKSFRRYQRRSGQLAAMQITD